MKGFFKINRKIPNYAQAFIHYCYSKENHEKYLQDWEKK